MEINFSPATEAQLQHLASRQGKNVAQVVEETVARVIEEQAKFIAGVERGIAASKRGDTISHEEVAARVNQIFNKS